MKTKLIAFFSLLSLMVFAFHTSSLEARHHHSTSVQFNFGASLPPPQYVVKQYHYPHYVYHYQPRPVYVTPVPPPQVYVYPAPHCFYCR